MYNPKYIFGYHILLLITMHTPESELLTGNLLKSLNTEAAITESDKEQNRDPGGVSLHSRPILFLQENMHAKQEREHP